MNTRDAQAKAARMADVFILYGALRSGTTMVRLMLANHPALSCVGETDFLFDHLRPDGRDWRYDRERLALDRVYRQGKLRAPDDLDGVPALEDMIDQMRREKPGAHPVLVLHRHAERALSLLPHAKVVHLLRDPRDVARSVIGMGWAGNVHQGVGLWMNTEDGWKDATSQRDVVAHAVRFEELVANPDDALRRICAFLGLPFDPAMLAYDATSTYDKPDARLAFQWKRKLSPRDVRRVEARLGPRLAAAGYAPSGLPPLRLSRAERAWLQAQNFVSTKSRLVLRYGLGNVLQRKFARLVGLHKMEAEAQQRMDDITRRLLK